MYRAMAGTNVHQVTVMWQGDTILLTTVDSTGQCGNIQKGLEAVDLIAEELFVIVLICINNYDNY